METKTKKNLMPVWIVMSLALVLLLISNGYAFKSITTQSLWPRI